LRLSGTIFEIVGLGGDGQPSLPTRVSG